MSPSAFFSRHPLRPLPAVPVPVLVFLPLVLIFQLGWHHVQDPPSARADQLPDAPTRQVMQLASLGEPIALAKALNLWLQAFDNQPGISIPFRELDYRHVRNWLETIIQLDPTGHYPLLAAARLYGEVPSPARQRQMLDFVYEKFLEQPGSRWPWMAHAVLVAKHRLHDLPLALKYARAIADNANGTGIPNWARQMVIFVLEDLGEREAARVLIGGLLASGQITDPHELNFLNERLEQNRSPGSRTRRYSHYSKE